MGQSTLITLTGLRAETFPACGPVRDRLRLLDRTDPLRPQAEALIQRIYGRAYGARPMVFAPLMVAHLSAENTVLAACGIRLAEDGFFSGQYLDETVAGAVSRVAGRKVDAREIIEVTTLASGSHRLGLVLLGNVIRLAWSFGISFGCSTATRTLGDALRRSGIFVERVADAVPSKVANPGQWGSYYSHEPGVYVVDDRPRMARTVSSDPDVEALVADLNRLRPQLAGLPYRGENL